MTNGIPAMRQVTILVTAVLALGACEPRVKLEAPDKPITINLNVKIEQEVRVRIERDAEDLLERRPDLF